MLFLPRIIIRIRGTGVLSHLPGKASRLFSHILSWANVSFVVFVVFDFCGANFDANFWSHDTVSFAPDTFTLLSAAAVVWLQRLHGIVASCVIACLCIFRFYHSFLFMGCYFIFSLFVDRVRLQEGK